MCAQSLEKKPLWYKNAVIYQLHIKGFYDTNEDGIGDFSGLTEKLDYLESLGVSAIWLLPFYPSPMKDGGYDISDYIDINPNYGTLSDFKKFLQEAHERGIRVISELVINHTSDQHPWFQRARYAKAGSVWRNFYVWSDTPDRYKEARIIFKDFEASNWTWDPIAKAYFWHRFYHHQPDLNFENPQVQKEVLKALDFWFELGVDGLRLDAIPYLFEKEGTNCENLPETHEFIKKLRKHIEDKFKDKVLIAEANQWPEDAAQYFGQGDECHMAFHFPVMPRLFMAIQMEDRFPILDILEQTPKIPDTCQWAMFLRNHDELTLEMVSDEERDYMYRMYAKDPKSRINLGIRRRLAPLLENNRAKIELMNILLLSLPGSPVIYYGDEIGMGDNYYLGDRDGVRTPMQWSSDRNAGFSKANPQMLYLPLIIDPPYHYEVINVDNQERNSSSLLWWFRRVLTARKSHKVFGNGTCEFVDSDNPKILSFIRSSEEQKVLVVANLSRFPQPVEIDLTPFAGWVPRELFNQNNFPAIKEKEPYRMTLGPYNYYWFLLQTPLQSSSKEEKMEKITAQKNWKEIFEGKNKRKLENEVLLRHLKSAEWFEKKRELQSVEIIDYFFLSETALCLLNASFFNTQEEECILIALSYTDQSPEGVMAVIEVARKEGVLYENTSSKRLGQDLIQFLVTKQHKNSQKITINPGQQLNRASLKEKIRLAEPFSVQKEHDFSYINYGTQIGVKFYRRLEDGINPDIEIRQFLTEKAHFERTFPFLGSIEWNRSHCKHLAIGLIEKIEKTEGDGWGLTLDALSRYYEQILTLKNFDEETAKIKGAPLSSSALGLSRELIGGSFLEIVRLLGQRTAGLHMALSCDRENPHFSPEPFSALYQRSLYQTLRSKVRSVFELLKRRMPGDAELKKLAEEVLNHEEMILRFYQKILQPKVDLVRIRIHGNYNLHQVLYTGKDFYIRNFYGEPLHAMSSRRLKRSALRDISGMHRSFHYAVHAALVKMTLRPEDVLSLTPWGNLWYQNVSALFLEAYLDAVRQNPFPLVPSRVEDLQPLLQIFLIDKSVNEIEYELLQRPELIAIPCKGLLYHL